MPMKLSGRDFLGYNVTTPIFSNRSLKGGGDWLLGICCDNTPAKNLPVLLVVVCSGCRKQPLEKIQNVKTDFRLKTFFAGKFLRKKGCAGFLPGRSFAPEFFF